MTFTLAAAPRAFVVAALGAAVIAVTGSTACSSPEETRLGPMPGVRGAAFGPVAEVLLARCGSLDCHGSKYRNMRLYGFGASRLDPADTPDGKRTTELEYQTDYEAVVSLEPLKIREVMEQGGAGPERLTFVRKARGVEGHKGGGRIVPGEPADLCILSWLAGTIDAAACKTGAE